MSRRKDCPDCESFDRRDFLKVSGATALALGATPLLAADATATSQPETLVKTLYDSLSPEQKHDVCFGWDYSDPKLKLLRSRVANNWKITKPSIVGQYYTKDQKDLVRKIFEGIYDPEWHARIDKQLEDDCGGFGHDQAIAIFGEPGKGKFEFVLTGRHMTIRCDGNSSEHVAFGGPIFYGHAASGDDEEVHHPGNVFWPQAVAANKVYGMLDGKQRKLALVDKLPRREQEVAFRGPQEQRPGIPLSEMSADQVGLVQETLKKLVEPYRQCDRDEVLTCLKAQGGLEKCSLSFFKEGDIGKDEEWDCWRLEGPAFVWYFRGYPHVHVWVNVADDPSVRLNA